MFTALSTGSGGVRVATPLGSCRPVRIRRLRDPVEMERSGYMISACFPELAGGDFVLGRPA